MSSKYFVTGIGTGIGKTIVSAIITQKLKADYWKPIQSGDLDQSDSLMVSNLVSNTKTKIHEERFRLSLPLSPHLSAKIDGVDLKIADFQIPITENNIVIEGAGGLMVPLNDKELMLDLIKALNTKVIVVSKNYLGSINHTLLTIQILKFNQIPVEGIIFNGEENSHTEQYIEQYSKLPILGRIPELTNLNQDTINSAGRFLNLNISQ
ncbi:dethiobiotin synthetase [Pedobacter sp. UYP24]